jgi:hypothetical protein
MKAAFEAYWDELERPKKQLAKVVEATSGEIRRAQSEIDLCDFRMVLKCLGMILGGNLVFSAVILGMAFGVEKFIHLLRP